MLKPGLGKWVVLSAIGASLLLVVANSAIWANRVIFNTERFTAVAVGSINSESSRRAFASEITDRALADYPRLKSVVQETAVNFISGLFGTQRVEQLTTRVVSKLHVILTSPPREEAVVINLEGLKDTLNRLIEISGREDETRVDPAKIPDQITLLEPRDIPNVYDLAIVSGWLSPLALLLALGLLVWPYFKPQGQYLGLFLVQGGIILLAGLLALAVGPLIKPALLGEVTNSNLRIVVGNLYDAFIGSFNQQTLIIVGVGLVLLLSSGVIWGYRLYKK